MMNSVVLHDQRCESGLVRCEKLKFNKKFGSPRPSAGEGLGVRGFGLMNQAQAHDRMPAC